MSYQNRPARIVRRRNGARDGTLATEIGGRAAVRPTCGSASRREEAGRGRRFSVSVRASRAASRSRVLLGIYAGLHACIRRFTESRLRLRAWAGHIDPERGWGRSVIPGKIAKQSSTEPTVKIRWLLAVLSPASFRRDDIADSRLLKRLCSPFSKRLLHLGTRGCMIFHANFVHRDSAARCRRDQDRQRLRLRL